MKSKSASDRWKKNKSSQEEANGSAKVHKFMGCLPMSVLTAFDLFRSSCYIVTRCTNLVSVHYFLPLGI